MIRRRRERRAERLERARGALLGLAAGDALGATVEWLHPEQIRARYGGPLRDLVAAGGRALGDWTGLTAMALELAASLCDRGGFDRDDVFARYALWARSAPRDGGPATAVLRRARDAAGARAAAQARNGADVDGADVLARAVPLAVRFHADGAELRRASAADASLTSGSPEAADAALHFALTLVAELEGRRPPPPASPLAAEAAAAASLTPAELEAAAHAAPGELRTALRVGFAAGLGAGSVEEAVVSAVNLGGDAAGAGCVAGALAGARFGAGSVPLRWLEPLRERDRIAGLASRLLRG